MSMEYHFTIPGRLPGYNELHGAGWRKSHRIKTEAMGRVLDRYLAPPQPTGMPGGSGNPDRLGEVAARREKYQRLIDEKLDQLIALRAEIEEAIAGLPSADRRLIRLRYIQGKRWLWLWRMVAWVQEGQ